MNYSLLEDNELHISELTRIIFFYSFCRHFSLMTSSENRTGLTVLTASGSCHVLALNFGRIAATRSIRCVADVALLCIGVVSLHTLLLLIFGISRPCLRSWRLIAACVSACTPCVSIAVWPPCVKHLEVSSTISNEHNSLQRRNSRDTCMTSCHGKL